ncbi:MAG: hypothetical protein B6I24_06750 [Bacteroidetes bacterium 4572_128]|nr:MAG: hypothetical protein B6I24_06750 [Bacteroidetes bacterium 4572_128]
MKKNYFICNKYLILNNIFKNKIMEENINAKIEDYIQDWHWEDEDSKKYAFEICKFLFSFIDYIDQLSVTKRTKTNHKYNVFLIGMFETDYGYNDKFSIKNLENGPDFLYEFERKVSNSKYF